MNAINIIDLYCWSNTDSLNTVRSVSIMTSSTFFVILLLHTTTIYLKGSNHNVSKLNTFRHNSRCLIEPLYEPIRNYSHFTQFSIFKGLHVNWTIGWYDQLWHIPFLFHDKLKIAKHREWLNQQFDKLFLKIKNPLASSETKLWMWPTIGRFKSY